ncbi:MAG: hypothetical protein RL685_5348 [Pseudomonadota bacterium]|jgi:hypothetical protein
MARNSGNVRQFGTVAVKAISWGLLVLAGAGSACSDDEDGAADGAAACVGGGGPVAGAADDHCVDDAGMSIVQSIGACSTTAVVDGDGEEEEELGVFYGSEANDDDCKYRVSFTHSCILQNRPVTFDVTLRRSSDGSVATGAMPSTVEVFMEDGHISPSNTFTGPERTPGTYGIGPVVFDRPGRWTVRFHFFETCSDIPEDSPHGHTAFYIDVP